MNRMRSPSAEQSPAMISTTAHKKRGAIRLWAVAAWLAIWQAGSMAVAAAFPYGNLLLASPAAVTVRLLELAATAEFWQTIAASSVRILGGFLTACILAVALAALSARFIRVREGLAPAVAAIKAVPVMSFIILALLWVPSEALSPLIAGLMVFPPIYLNVLTGISNADVQLLEMARLFRVPFGRTLAGIYLPQVFPYFRSAVSLALGLCWKAGVAAEVLGVVKTSLGAQLYNAKIYFATADLFAWTLVIVMLSAVFEKLLLRLLDRLAGKVGALWK